MPTQASTTPRGKKSRNGSARHRATMLPPVCKNTTPLQAPAKAVASQKHESRPPAVLLFGNAHGPVEAAREAGLGMLVAPLTGGDPGDERVPGRCDMAAIPSFFYEGGLPTWLMLAAALAGWIVLLRAITRLFMRTRERVQCPVKGREATVIFVRAPDGSKDDVASCSLLEGDATCEQDCLHPAPEARADGAR